MREIKLTAFLGFGLLLAAWTQLAHLTSVPGLHFDEAWQGLFAQRIASENGFWPLAAMNSYTGPVSHYLLAAVFKIFSPSLAAMRGTLAAINLFTLLAIAALLWRRNEKSAAAWFTLIWALLPLSIHNHRFYIEVTSIHGLCVAAILWGFQLWKSHPRFSSALVLAGAIIGIYSHILFVGIVAALLVSTSLFDPVEFASRRARLLTTAVIIFAGLLFIRMGIGLRKPFPAIVGAGAIALSYFSARFWPLVTRFSKNIIPVVTVVAIPFLLSFIGLHWNGAWPYAQATGTFIPLWLPLNALLLIGLAALAFSRERRWKDWFATRSATWIAFVTTFTFVSLIVFKQASRYYMVPAIFAMLFCARQLARLPGTFIQPVIAVMFVGWNLWTFEIEYLHRFETYGATTVEFRAGPFHDNSRDFRPFQKPFAWAMSQNCFDEIDWVEDDRFGLPVQFMRLTAAPHDPHAAPCPWKKGQIFFSHIPNYDAKFAGPRTAENTPPPVENVSFLAHLPEWGDLAYWLRK